MVLGADDPDDGDVSVTSFGATFEEMAASTDTDADTATDTTDATAAPWGVTATDTDSTDDDGDGAASASGEAATGYTPWDGLIYEGDTAGTGTIEAGDSLPDPEPEPTPDLEDTEPGAAGPDAASEGDTASDDAGESMLLEELEHVATEDAPASEIAAAAGDGPDAASDASQPEQSAQAGGLLKGMDRRQIAAAAAVIAAIALIR